MEAKGSGSVVDRYIAAWTTGDIDAVMELLARNLVVEANLAQGREFADTLGDIAAAAVVAVVSRVDSGGRTLIVYDCTARNGAGKSRVVEYIDSSDGEITSVRRVYDKFSAARVVPRLSSPV